ncbi:hypothetical protein RE428_44590 [Marinobacter nanhaiticus D15-8W]|nr:hypothetical protein RE428_44590 [Marinobacter nanhaiticus D15-8W]
MVIVDAAVFCAIAIGQGKRAEAVRLVEVGAVVVAAFLGDQAVALPDKFGALVVVFLGDASAKGIVGVAEAAAVGADHFHQAVFAVVAIGGAAPQV